MKPHKCPVCEGRGQVPYNFYEQPIASTALDTVPVLCRACNGTGIVWEYDPVGHVYPYNPPGITYTQSSTTLIDNGNSNVKQ